MRERTRPTRCANVVQRIALIAALAIAAMGCAERKTLPAYRGSPVASGHTAGVTCDIPNISCACDSPGTLVDCGELRSRTDNYVTCMQGVRRCGEDGTWGACLGNVVEVAAQRASAAKPLALGEMASCVDENPCDPLCRQIVDTAVGLTGLPEGLCSMETGLGVCPLCSYSGASSQLPYLEMPPEWQRVPTTCSITTDQCVFDMACVGGTCRSRTEPCTAPNQSCSADMTLGKACIDLADPNDNFHIPLCNRGTNPLTSGVVRIGVDTRSASVAACTPAGASGLLSGFPNSGYIELFLSADQKIDAGACIDVNAANSQSFGLDLTGSRALVANYDGTMAECNPCNNGSAIVVQSTPSTSSTCTECVGTGCDDPSLVQSTLNGVLFDPAGQHAVPNAIVYVPNTAVLPFAEGVGCDTCDSVVSGTPSVWVRTDALGGFSLRGVPSGRSFAVVAQVGRWRRQYVVGPIPSGTTRWVQSCRNDEGRIALSIDENEPTAPDDRAQRMRLPATQRRCIGATCSGEGDIPKTAVMLGAADPVQCALRRIGIDDSEFTNDSGSGRLQLFNGNGMHVVAGGAGLGAGGLLSRTNSTNAPRLNDFSMFIAPCDGEHDRVRGLEYAHSPYASGPSYNSWPDPAATDSERATVKAFVDVGGRLLATHWQSLDFVHLNYFPPTRADFAAPLGSAPLVSPYDAARDTPFQAAIATYRAAMAPGFDWAYAFSSNYNALAPAQYQFGDNLNSGGNVLDALASGAVGGYPALMFSPDASSTLGQLFSDWALNVGASSFDNGYQIPWQNWSPMVRRVRSARGVTRLLSSASTSIQRFASDTSATRNPPVQQKPCLQGSDDAYDCSTGQTWGGGLVGMYQFEAPLDADQKCGRTAVISGHASQPNCIVPNNARLSKYCGNAPPYSATNPAPDCDCLTFPAQAETGCGSSSTLTPEELSFEFLLFSASQCIGELSVPQVPDPPALATNLFVRDFVSDCSEDKQTVWQLFSWQATVPNGARLEFYAATADTQAELPGEGFATIGVADATTTRWTAANHTVAEFLRMAEPPQSSKKWLRVEVVFVPNASATPVLSQWRAIYNCIDDQ